MPKWVIKILKYKNIKIQSRRKIIKSTICNLSSFRMFIKKEQSSNNNNLEESYTKRKAKHESYG